jgi:hypothetical protein
MKYLKLFYAGCRMIGELAAGEQLRSFDLRCEIAGDFFA